MHAQDHVVARHVRFFKLSRHLVVHALWHALWLLSVTFRFCIDFSPLHNWFLHSSQQPLRQSLKRIPQRRMIRALRVRTLLAVWLEANVYVYTAAVRLFVKRLLAGIRLVHRSTLFDTLTTITIELGLFRCYRIIIIWPILSHYAASHPIYPRCSGFNMSSSAISSCCVHISSYSGNGLRSRTIQ